MAHPTEVVHLPSIFIACAGPMIFMAGNILFRLSLGRNIPWTYVLPFVAMPLIGWFVHETHASGIVLGLGMLLAGLAVAAVNPDRGGLKVGQPS